MEEAILFGLLFFFLGMMFAYWVFLYPIDRDNEAIDDIIRNIDDIYHEAFSLFQEELEKLIEEYKDKDIPSQKIYELLCVTDMFRKRIYIGLKKKGRDEDNNREAASDKFGGEEI